MSAMISRLLTTMETLRLRPTRAQGVRFAVSLILATLLWGWVTDLQDPYTTIEFRNVTISDRALPENLQMVSEVPNVTVTIRGAKSRVTPVNRDEVSVSFDTSGIDGPGEYRVALIPETPNVSDRSVDPEEVTIRIDERVSRDFPLEVSTSSSGDQARTVGDPIPAVSQVTVTGPTSAVDRIAKVILPVVVDDQTESFSASFMPYAVDQEGQRIVEVEILPGVVQTQVEIQTKGKAVSVIPVISGEPQDGFSIQQRRALPDTIVVDGPEDVLSELLFLNTEPVDVTGATESMSVRVGLADLPPGVTIIEPVSGQVEVRVAIENTATSSQTLTDLPIESIGLDSGLAAEFAPSTVSIQVSAPVEILQAMTPDDIKILVDLGGLESGTYRVTPDVTVPQGATWSGDNMVTIVVTISEIPESTPLPATPAATPS